MTQTKKTVATPKKKSSPMSMKIFSNTERAQMQESMNQIQARIYSTSSMILDKRLNESKISPMLLKESIQKDAILLERMIIQEAISDGDFHTLQQNFRSLLGVVDHLITDFDGTDLAQALYDLRGEGNDLLNELVEYIMDLEDRYAGKGAKEHTLDPRLKKVRQNFIKVFTDIATIVRGMISLSDSIGDSKSSEIVTILASLKRAGDTDKSLLQALKTYDTQLGIRGDAKKATFLDKMMGKAGPRGLLAKFKEEIIRAVTSKSPGFSKLVDMTNFVSYMLSKMSADKLMQTLNTLDHIVANEVDVDFILKMTKEPSGVWNTVKSMLGNFGGAGSGIGGGGFGGGAR